MTRSRRDFLVQLASVTAATATFSAIAHGMPTEVLRPDIDASWQNSTTANHSSPSERKIGYCIVGLGRISMGEFMPGLRIAKQSKLVALVSGHRPKAERMADLYGLSHKAIYNYENYDTIRNNPEIDAVYIALPNGMHAEYTIRAAKAGKHVLCEKPMANSIQECEQMIAACKQANRKLLIAYRCRYEPNTLKAIQVLRSGYAGKIQNIQAAFGFNIKPGEWRLNKKMAGGGPLVDVGVYCIQATRYLTGEEPTEVQGFSSVVDHDGRFTEVEENLVWNTRFPSGVVADCATSYGSSYTGNIARVTGDKGMLKLDPAYSYSGIRGGATAKDAQPMGIDINDPNPNQFAREADVLAECILQNKEPLTNGEEGLRDERIITAIYQSCAEGRPVYLGGRT
ncbi:MAG: Gfo/Idh/MocA family oxidoreductase [Acidobacteriaceae bacterium]